MNRTIWTRLAAVSLLALAFAAACADNGDENSNDPGMAMDEPGMAMAMTTLGATTWEGMRISLASAAPTTFTLFQGDEVREVTPQPADSVHLMVVLADEETSERIPYAAVWVTVRDADENIVFDERMWPMISRAMGTHYGSNVPLPAAGTYAVAVQIGPPQAARHPEYADRWLEPFTFESSLGWDGG